MKLIIWMIIILGFNMGGFIFLVFRAMRKKSY